MAVRYDGLARHVCPSNDDRTMDNSGVKSTKKTGTLTVPVFLVLPTGIEPITNP